jgi:hypothetical protein
MKNRRKSERHKLRALVDVVSGEEMTPGVVKDISLNGLFIWGHFDLFPGQKVYLIVHLRTHDEGPLILVPISGTVMRIETVDDGEKLPGISVATRAYGRPASLLRPEQLVSSVLTVHGN